MLRMSFPNVSTNVTNAGFPYRHPAKDFVCESDKSQIWDFWDLWDATVFSRRIRANGISIDECEADSGEHNGISLTR